MKKIFGKNDLCNRDKNIIVYEVLNDIINCTLNSYGLKENDYKEILFKLIIVLGKESNEIKKELTEKQRGIIEISTEYLIV